MSVLHQKVVTIAKVVTHLLVNSLIPQRGKGYKEEPRLHYFETSL